jgi:hypothetical protein
MGVIEDAGGLVNDGVALGREVVGKIFEEDPGADPDRDGASNATEWQYHSDPNNPDSDGDGLTDGQEYAGSTSATSADTDGDGVTDPDELAMGTDPTLDDSDRDGLRDGGEIRLGTDPLDADTDNDGIADGAEVSYWGGTGTDPRSADTDGDGLRDGDELTLRTNPRNADTDGDGLTDGVEQRHGFDPNDPDTHDDGWGDKATYDFGASLVGTDDAATRFAADPLAQSYNPNADYTRPPSGGGGADDAAADNRGGFEDATGPATGLDDAFGAGAGEALGGIVMSPGPDFSGVPDLETVAGGGGFEAAPDTAAIDDVTTSNTVGDVLDLGLVGPGVVDDAGLDNGMHDDFDAVNL